MAKNSKSTGHIHSEEQTGLLTEIVLRVEYLEKQRFELLGDIKSAFSEAKDAGLDVGTIRRLIKRRSHGPDVLIRMRRNPHQYDCLGKQVWSMKKKDQMLLRIYQQEVDGLQKKWGDANRGADGHTGPAGRELDHESSRQ